MTNNSNCIQHFEEWCNLDPKLPTFKDGDGEYEDETTFNFWRVAEFMYKKGVWDGASEMQKQCNIDYDEISDLQEALRLLWFFLPEHEPCNPHSNKSADKERNKRWHSACSLYQKYAGQL